MLVTSGDDDSACIWSLMDRSLMRTFRGSEHTVFSSEFTPDGSNLITSDTNGDLRLWEVEANHNKPIAFVEEAHDLGVLCCEFAPWTDENGGTSLDKKFVLATGGNDDCVKLWTVITGLNTKIMSRKKISGHHNSAVMCVRFSKDGKYLVSTGGDKMVIFYDVSTGEVLRRMTPHDRYVGSCAFSNTGVFFTTGSNDKSVIIFELEEYKALGIEEENYGLENRQRLSFLAGKEDAMMIDNVAAHNGDINDMVFVNNDDLVTCSSDKTVKFWKSIAKGAFYREQEILETRSYALYSMDFCKSKNLLLISGTDGEVTIWNTLTWKNMESLICPGRSAIRTCKVSPNGMYVVIGGTYSNESYLIPSTASYLPPAYLQV